MIGLGLALPVLSQMVGNMTRGITGQERSFLQKGAFGKIPLPPFLQEIDKVVGTTALNMMRVIEKGPEVF